MKIKLTSVFVDDQAKACAFIRRRWLREEGGLQQRPFRWLTVVREEPEGTSCSWRSTMTRRPKPTSRRGFKQGQPAVMFFTDDLQADYERIKARGVEFIMAPTDVTGSKIAKLNDGCGNLIQVTQLVPGRRRATGSIARGRPCGRSCAGSLTSGTEEAG